MVVRTERAYFGSALVFPGGIVDPEDAAEAWLERVTGYEGMPAIERSLRIAGYRELYEETGLLLAGEAPSAPAPAGAAFHDVVERSGARLDLSAMHPFAHWITPQTSPKRYDTHFRLCAAGTDAVAISDGLETVSVEWLRPADALAMGRSGERKVLFPTRLNLERLALSSSVDEAIEAARARTIVTVTPRLERRPEGLFITAPEEAGYGPAEEFAGPAR